MAFPIVAIPLVMSLFKIASTYAIYNMQEEENNRARKEALGLAQKVRSDELGQFNIDIDNENKQLDISGRSLDFKKDMATKKSDLVNRSDKYEVNKLGREGFVNSVQSLKPTENSWLYKNKVLGRY